jgi:ParB-like chromosome segregation protein Spo0J
MSEWQPGEIRPVPIEALGERYRCYRLPDADAEAAMARSLERYGQMAPIVVCLREDRPEVLDGFKRLMAARLLATTKVLSVRLLAADERAAKAAIYGLNQASRHTQELEEAWIVTALVREDGLSQLETAELLGRHKSWVCRRLALVERLAQEAREDLRLGLLTPTAARALVQLPAGNQAEVLACARRFGLSTAELRGVVELLRGAAGRSQAEYVLARPREALALAQADGGRVHDPRLSVSGNRVARQLAQLLEQLAWMENWLLQRGRAGLSLCEGNLLAERFAQLGGAAGRVAALSADLYEELRQP